MKKMLYIYKKWPAILAFSSLLAVSCKKLIEIPPNPINEIPQQQVFTDSADIMSALVGIYANFKTTGGSPSFSSGDITINAGMSADELLASNASDILANAITVNDGTVQNMWKQAYSDLYQMNACLQGIGSTTVIGDSVKQQLLGEIRVVRALYYFNMVNLFGGVPVVTGTDYKINATLPRATVDSVYSLIKSDLAAARSVLTPNYPSSGRARPNLYTAEALSAKVYLYLQQWDSAALMAGQVIQSGQYSLEPNLNNVFLDGSNEAIWQLPASGTTYQTAEAAAFIPYLSNSAPPYTSYSAPPYPLSANLMGAFEAADQRQTSWVTTITVRTSVYPIPYKYKNRKAIAPTVEDYMVLRLSEQYLIQAEALAHQNQLNDALTSLNLVRARAGLTGSSAVSQADVLTAILHERQTELFCEWGNRWYDLKRTGTIDAVLGAEKTGWQPNAALYPIPLLELQSNPFLVQNPGY
jgi:hypothetical protein